MKFIFFFRYFLGKRVEFLLSARWSESKGGTIRGKTRETLHLNKRAVDLECKRSSAVLRWRSNFLAIYGTISFRLTHPVSLTASGQNFFPAYCVYFAYSFTYWLLISISKRKNESSKKEEANGITDRDKSPGITLKEAVCSWEGIWDQIFVSIRQKAHKGGRATHSI